MADRQYELGDAELEILKVLWDRGASTVRDVLHTLHDQGRGVAYTTVQTLLTRLEGKSFVRSDKSDFAFVYRARLTRDRRRLDSRRGRRRSRRSQMRHEKGLPQSPPRS